ncbi:helix-turn-helix domain-containing protein [Taibaiella lutea]|nr:helix-turn-helix transcriptional regulator [Taibaiella lutea]
MKQEHPNIGDNIRKLRELRNYTQQYMADNLGVSTVQYGKLEHSEDINTKYLFRVAEILETSVQKILHFDSEIYFEVHNNSNNKEINTYGKVEHFHQAINNSEEQQLLIALMKRLIEKMG